MRNFDKLWSLGGNGCLIQTEIGRNPGTKPIAILFVRIPSSLLYEERLFGPLLAEVDPTNLDQVVAVAQQADIIRQLAEFRASVLDDLRDAFVLGIRLK